MSQIQVDNIYNKEATGSPSFPLGANVTGVITATTFKGGAEITSGTISATSATFSGAVSVGGTLTYEDVTNIDSVGVITARNGINVSGGTGTFAGNINANGNIVGDNSTNISGVSSVTATNFYGNGASLSGIDAAPVASGVANGSIGVGTAVAVQSDGKFVAVTGTNSFHGVAAEITSDPTVKNHVVYAPDIDKFVTSYVEYSTDKTRVIVGTPSADGKTVNWDTGNATNPNPTGTRVCQYSDICYDTANNKVVCVFRDEGSRMDSVVGTISGTTISWGTPVNFDSAGSNYGSAVAFDSSTGKVVTVWRQDGTTYEIRVGTVSGTSITWGTVATSTTNDTAITPTIAAANGHFVIAGRDNYHVGSYTGTTITMAGGAGGEGTIPFSNGNTSTDHTVVTVDPDTNVYMMGGPRNSTDNYIEVFAATRSGTTLTFGAGKVLSANVSYNLAMCPAGQQNKFFVSWGFEASASRSAIITVSNNEITMTDPYTYRAENQTHNGCAGCVFNPDTGAVVVVFSNYGGGRDGWYYCEGIRNTTGTRGAFVGFSNAAYTNGQTAKVSIAGAVSTNQSGLTAAQAYYLKGDGTLVTVPSSGDFFVGNALSATNLLLR